MEIQICSPVKTHRPDFQLAGMFTFAGTRKGNKEINKEIKL